MKNVIIVIFGFRKIILIILHLVGLKFVKINSVFLKFPPLCMHQVNSVVTFYRLQSIVVLK